MSLGKNAPAPTARGHKASESSIRAQRPQTGGIEGLSQAVIDSSTLGEKKKAEPPMTQDPVTAQVQDIDPHPNRAIEAGTDNELTLVEHDTWTAVSHPVNKAKLVKYLSILVLLVIILTLLSKLIPYS